MTKKIKNIRLNKFFMFLKNNTRYYCEITLNNKNKFIR